eukprot:scaffold57852_cov63-Phaeocystis_antarctica.AAC.1
MSDSGATLSVTVCWGAHTKCSAELSSLYQVGGTRARRRRGVLVSIAHRHKGRRGRGCHG